MAIEKVTDHEITVGDLWPDMFKPPTEERIDEIRQEVAEFQRYEMFKYGLYVLFDVIAGDEDLDLLAILKEFRSLFDQFIHEIEEAE